MSADSLIIPSPPPLAAAPILDAFAQAVADRCRLASSGEQRCRPFFLARYVQDKTRRIIRNSLNRLVRRRMARSTMIHSRAWVRFSSR